MNVKCIWSRVWRTSHVHADTQTHFRSERRPGIRLGFGRLGITARAIVIAAPRPSYGRLNSPSIARPSYGGQRLRARVSSHGRLKGAQPAPGEGPRAPFRPHRRWSIARLFQAPAPGPRRRERRHPAAACRAASPSHRPAGRPAGASRRPGPRRGPAPDPVEELEHEELRLSRPRARGVELSAYGGGGAPARGDAPLPSALAGATPIRSLGPAGHRLGRSARRRAVDPDAGGPSPRPLALSDH